MGMGQRGRAKRSDSPGFVRGYYHNVRRADCAANLLNASGKPPALVSINYGDAKIKRGRSQRRVQRDLSASGLGRRFRFCFGGRQRGGGLR